MKYLIFLFCFSAHAGNCVYTGKDTAQCSDGTVIVRDRDTINFTNNRYYPKPYPAPERPAPWYAPIRPSSPWSNPNGR